MKDIIALLSCLVPYLDKTISKQLFQIIVAMLSMTGRITMLGISRWTDKGGSYRTIQRFFNKTITWCKVNWFFIRHNLLNKDNKIAIAADETVVTKSGKKTYGIDRFFSSIFSKPVFGISFFCISLLNIKERTSYPVIMEQIIKDEEEKSTKQKRTKGKGKRGRPKGSKNTNRREIELPSYLLWVQALLRNLLKLVGRELQIMYFVFDGAFGNNNALQMVRQCSLHLISKLRYDSSLWFPYDGAYSGKGRHKKYGKKLNYTKIPDKYLKSTSEEGNLLTKVYQMQMWSKNFPDLLNIVVIVKRDLKTDTIGWVVLFSSDLDLQWNDLIEYYRLRFHIEFNFRDAKQYWGLEDFMNVNHIPVYNGANLSMFMVNVSQALLRQYGVSSSVNDLKSWFRGRKYAHEIFKLLPEKPEPVIIELIYTKIAALGRINRSDNVA